MSNAPYNPQISCYHKDVIMDAQAYARKLQYRASHRGTREADAMVGGFYAHYSADWSADDYAWFERLLEEQDVDIMAWGLRTQEPPVDFRGPMMDLLQRLDFISLPVGLAPQD
jgi:antitoxin CptB